MVRAGLSPLAFCSGPQGTTVRKSLAEAAGKGRIRRRRIRGQKVIFPVSSTLRGSPTKFPPEKLSTTS